jgi:hypothetical protein
MVKHGAGIGSKVALENMRHLREMASQAYGVLDIQRGQDTVRTHSNACAAQLIQGSQDALSVAGPPNQAIDDPRGQRIDADLDRSQTGVYQTLYLFSR